MSNKTYSQGNAKSNFWEMWETKANNTMAEKQNHGYLPQKMCQHHQNKPLTGSCVIFYPANSNSPERVETAIYGWDNDMNF